MPELLVHGGLRERAFRTQIADLQRLLLRQAGRHDLPKQANHFLISQRTGITLDYGTQNLRFALGAKEINCFGVVALGNCNLLPEPGTRRDQRVNLFIDGVDFVLANRDPASSAVSTCLRPC